MLLVFSKSGKTVHRKECRFALGSEVETYGISRSEVVAIIETAGGKQCKKCKPFAKCKVFLCDTFRESGKGFCKPHIL